MPMRSRELRRPLGVVALIGAAAAAMLWQGSAVHPPRPHDLMLVYVGADDCPPCRAWKRGPGAAFRASPEFPQLTYREVEAPSVLNLLSDQYWPDDLRNYRKRLGPNAGVPLWLLVADHQVIERGFGASQWHQLILPKLKALLQQNS